jgi:glycosyltransferase involved in cell wall biosynthesis
VPVKNEEANLAKCLELLGEFSEIVVIDSSSTDSTQQIALSFGARVENFVWNGRYPKKRNWMLLNAPPTQPWVLFLDADEFVDEQFCEALRIAVTDASYDGYWLNYTNYFLGQRLKYGLEQRKLPLFRVGKGLYERIEEDGWSQLDMEIHEHPIIEGRVGEIRVPIDHRDYKGLGKFIEKHRDYALWEARRYKSLIRDSENWEKLTRRQRFKYQNVRKWWYPWFYFVFTYIVKRGFLDGAAGFHYAAYKAWYFQTIRLLIQENDSLPV